MLILASIILLMLIVGSYFIFFKEKTEFNPIPEKKSTQSFVDLMLPLSAFGSDWEISDKKELADGYETTFKVKKDQFTATEVYITQGVYIQNTSHDMDNVRKNVAALESMGWLTAGVGEDRYRTEMLPNPNIENDSVAYRIVWENSNGWPIYFIQFVKSNYSVYFEGIQDYEFLKEQAEKSEDLIP